MPKYYFDLTRNENLCEFKGQVLVLTQGKPAGNEASSHDIVVYIIKRATTADSIYNMSLLVTMVPNRSCFWIGTVCMTFELVQNVSSNTDGRVWELT